MTADQPSPQNAAAFLRDLFDTAVAAARPDAALGQYLPPPPPEGRILVIGAGKAATGMARAVADHYRDAPRLSGLVITRHGQGETIDRITVREAAHPVPDAAGLAATQDLLALTRDLTPQDLVIALISGGASSLMVAPLAGLGLEDKMALNQALLRSGASIAQMNCLRRHLSQVKGGRLAAACAPARVISLLISDVPGDDPSTIASGPCTADASTAAEALALLDLLAIDLPRIRTALATPAAESVKPGDPRLARVEQHLVASPQRALEAAAERARAAGIGAHILGDALEGESRDMGLMLAGLARQVALRGQPFARPCVILSGGETTVTLTRDGAAGLGAPGIGGRCVEFLLSFLVAARDLPADRPAHALAADTDGIDGGAEVAGALALAGDYARARAQGLEPEAFLRGHDAHSFFARMQRQIITGPTGTNVNDFRAILLP